MLEDLLKEIVQMQDQLDASVIGCSLSPVFGAPYLFSLDVVALYGGKELNLLITEVISHDDAVILASAAADSFDELERLAREQLEDNLERCFHCERLMPELKRKENLLCTHCINEGWVIDKEADSGAPIAVKYEDVEQGA